MLFTLKNDELNVIVSSFGGCIERIQNKKNGQDHYWSYQSEDWPRRTAVCFPICGGLLGGNYRYNGQTYFMESHGFLRERELLPTLTAEDSASFVLVSDQETRASYPFDFRFQIEYQLDGNSLIVHYIVKNTGVGTMYFSTGAHYTYAVPLQEGETYQDYCYRFNGVQRAGKLLVKNNLVTGVSEDIFAGRDYLPINGMFNSGSTILRCQDLTECSIRIESMTSGAATSVAFDGFRYVILWAPKDGAPFACIEPWAGMIDTMDADGQLQNKLGIVSLEAGETRTYTQRISAVR